MATDHVQAAQGTRRRAGTVEWSRITPARERAVLCDATGSELSWLFMETSRVRIGSAVVKAGVVGGVETRADCRGQGHGRVVMEAALARFAQKNCTIGFLFGIPDYYRNFGYDSVVPYHAMLLDLWRVTPGAVTDVKCWPFEPKDLTAVSRLYTSANARRTGVFVRDARSWRDGGGSRQLGEAICAVDARARVCGYAKCGGELFLGRWMGEDVLPAAVLVPESAAADCQAAAALIHHLASAATAEKRRYLLFLCPPDSLVGHTLYNLGAQYRRSAVPRGGGIQARIVRLLPLMQLLETDLSARLRQSCFAAVDRRLTLTTELGGVELRIRRGRLSVEAASGEGIAVGMRQLVQLVFGFLPTSGIGGEEGRIIDVLFPEQCGHTWALDETI